MARQITVLETKKASDGITSVNGVFWFPITNANARVPLPQYVSALVAVPAPNNVTAAEQALLESGEIREEFFTVNFPASTTITQLKNQLIARYNDRKAAVDAEPATRAFYGVTYDGTGWSS